MEYDDNITEGSAEDVLKLEQLLMRLKESLRVSDDFNYVARSDAFRRLEEFPLWIATVVGVKGNLTALFGGSMVHSVTVNAYLENGDGIELLLITFESRMEAIQYGAIISKILDKVSIS